MRLVAYIDGIDLPHITYNIPEKENRMVLEFSDLEPEDLRDGDMGLEPEMVLRIADHMEWWITTLQARELDWVLELKL